MTTPRRTGWVLLLAVAGLTVGGALAVRAKKRKRTPPPAAVAAPRPATGGQADPERSLVRMAIGAAIVVVLAIVTVVVTRPSNDHRTVTPRMMLTPSAGPDGTYIRVAVPGPVGRDQRVILAGDNGARVEVDSKHYTDRPDYNDPGRRDAFFTVHLHNTGQVPVGARLDPDAWVVDATGTSYRADPMRSQVVDQSGGPEPQLDPGWEADLTVGFPVPQAARLTRLHIALPLGGGTATAEWNLQ